VPPSSDDDVYDLSSPAGFLFHDPNEPCDPAFEVPGPPGLAVTWDELDIVSTP